MKVLMVLLAAVSLSAATSGLLYSRLVHPFAYPVYTPSHVTYSGVPVTYSGVPVAYSGVPVTYSGVPVAYSAATLNPASVSSQYHTQDSLGQYNYGYSDSNSAKQEVRTADGITRGGYSYVDANGIVQSTSYVSDPVNGFRVAATNLPQGAAPSAVPVRIAAPSAVPVRIAAPAAVALAGAAPIVSYPGLYPVSNQYHAQDALGQYSYGYSGGPSAKEESRTLDGVTRGSYSYIDANGIVQTVRYEADAVHGFRVAATNLPIGPAGAAAAAETPELKAARVAHEVAHAQAKASPQNV